MTGIQNTHYTNKDVESFYRPHKFIDGKLQFSENQPLKELSKEIAQKYNNIRAQDIYFILPQLFCKINSFLLFESEKINVDYYHIINNFVNFVPITQVPDKIEEYEEYTDFFEEIIFKTLDQADIDFEKCEIYFDLKFGFKILNYPKRESVTIDKKIDIVVDEEGALTIRGEYKDGYLPDRIGEAIDDLFLIINLLEANDLLHIEDTNKSIHHEKMYIGSTKFDVNNFTFTNGLDWDVVDFYYVKKYLNKFYETSVGILDIDYFYLLSKRVKNTNLITASNFFGTDIFRFESQKFLKYWQAIEIMLGSPEKNIKNEIKSKFKLFFSNDEDMIDNFRKTRNKIVHRGQLRIHSDEIRKIMDISKKLFLKLILASYK